MCLRRIKPEEASAVSALMKKRSVQILTIGSMLVTIILLIQFVTKWIKQESVREWGLLYLCVTAIAWFPSLHAFIWKKLRIRKLQKNDAECVVAICVDKKRVKTTRGYTYRYTFETENGQYVTLERPECIGKSIQPNDTCYMVHAGGKDVFFAKTE